MIAFCRFCWDNWAAIDLIFLQRGCSRTLGSDPSANRYPSVAMWNKERCCFPHASVGESVFAHGVQPAATRGGGGGAGGRINARSAAVPSPSAVGRGCVEL